MGQIISIEQSAIIKGRQIMDCILIANEVIDDLKRKGWSSLIFKVDFEKAFDCVSWSYLDS